MSYYLDSYDTNSYYATAALLTASQEDLLLNGGHYNRTPPSPPRATVPYLGPATNNNNSTIPNSHLQQHPTYDPNSPFNSPIVPVKTIGKDGRLKTILKGIGIDGGFLTSPLSFGRKGSSTLPAPPPHPPASLLGSELPYLGDMSRQPTMMSQQGSYQNNNNSIDNNPTTRTLSPQQESQLLGMGITGVEEQQQQQQHFRGNYSDVASSSNQGEVQLAGAVLPLAGAYQQRTVSAAAGVLQSYVSGGRDSTGVGSPKTPQRQPPSIHFADGLGPQTHDTAGTAKPPSTKRVKKTTSTWSLKKLSKAKSCSSLTAAASLGATTPTSRSTMAPLTPTSAHASYFPLPGVPFNSPIDTENLAAEPLIMPFSFAELYNYGLAHDSVADIDARKSPYDFTAELLNAENATGRLVEEILNHEDGARYIDDLSEYGTSYGLPTPHLAPSGLSSPSTDYVSDTSPPYQQQTSPDFIATSVILAPPTLLPASAPSRQRCISYGHPHLPSLEETHERAISDATISAAMSAQISSISAGSSYSTTDYSYPTPYSVDGTQPIAPYQEPSGYLPSSFAHAGGAYVASGGHYPSHSTSFSGTGGTAGLFETRGGLFGPLPALPSAEAQLRGAVSLDNMYHSYQHESGASTPNKRGRETTDDEDFGTDGDEYLPVAGRPGVPTPKRQRIVSAPALVGRRLKPGPRPKSASRSPQENGESVFASPPPLPTLRHSSSTPYLGDASPFFDDEVDFANLPDQPSGHTVEGIPLAREVIQSLYNVVEAHYDQGIKILKTYECLIEGCGRAFPRKSAVENHIQTHLSDKPFVCMHSNCEASFVRQHDLRRHERIHSGNKPFPCPCGKGFARGDALHRHRQRGICAGSIVPRAG